MDLGQFGDSIAARLSTRAIVDPCERLRAGQAGPHESPGHHGTSHIIHDPVEPAARYDRQWQAPIPVVVQHRIHHGIKLLLDQVELGITDIDHHASSGTPSDHLADLSHALLQTVAVNIPGDMPSHNVVVTVIHVLELLIAHTVDLRDSFVRAHFVANIQQGFV